MKKKRFTRFILYSDHYGRSSKRVNKNTDSPNTNIVITQYSVEIKQHVNKIQTVQIQLLSNSLQIHSPKVSLKTQKNNKIYKTCKDKDYNNANMYLLVSMSSLMSINSLE